MNDSPAYTGLEIMATVVYDDTAGVGVSNAFDVQLTSAAQVDTLTSDVNTLYAAAPAEMWIPVGQVEIKKPGLVTQYAILTLHTDLAADEAAVTFP